MSIVGYNRHMVTSSDKSDAHNLMAGIRVQRCNNIVHDY